MTREQLEHILRAASKIARDPDVLVIGSQSVLGSFAEDDLPFEATSSIEADVAFFDDPADAKADQVDGAIGELSPFPVNCRVLRAGRQRQHRPSCPKASQSRIVAFDTPHGPGEFDFCVSVSPSRLPRRCVWLWGWCLV